jgi:hypothetical protein
MTMTLTIKSVEMIMPMEMDVDVSVEAVGRLSWARMNVNDALLYWVVGWIVVAGVVFSGGKI